MEKFFNGKIPEAFTKGKFNLNMRFRYEFADQSNLPEDSNAATLRTRFGFTTAPLYGFQAMIEGENVVALNDYDNYNAAGSNGQPGRPVVADPGDDGSSIRPGWVTVIRTLSRQNLAASESPWTTSDSSATSPGVRMIRRSMRPGWS